MVAVSRYILWFALYSVVGWVYETILCSIDQRKLVNRGFLNGPYCPIYGSGAVVCLLLFGSIQNWIVLFLAGMVVTTAMEYFTSWVLEKLFYARWWDYSDRKLNINGRVCLLGSLVFGTMIMLLIKIIHPAVRSLTDRIPDVSLLIFAVAFSGLFIVDIIFTVIHMRGFNEKLKQIQGQVGQTVSEYVSRVEEMKQHLEEGIRQSPLSQHLHELSGKLRLHERKTLRSFPHFRSTRYNEAVGELRTALQEYVANRKKNRKQ